MKPPKYIQCPECGLSAYLYGVNEKGAYRYCCPNYHKLEKDFTDKKTEQTDPRDPFNDPDVLDSMGEAIKEQIDKEILDSIVKENRNHNKRRVYLYERSVEDPNSWLDTLHDRVDHMKKKIIKLFKCDSI